MHCNHLVCMQPSHGPDVAHATWHHSSPHTHEQQLLLSSLKLFPHCRCILISLPGFAALMYLWYRKPAPGVYKQASFCQIEQCRMDSCYDNISSSTRLDFYTACFSCRSDAQSTRACRGGDRRLLAHESAWEAYRKLPWEQYYRHRRSIHCANSRGTVTLVLAPLRTSQVPLIVPTQEAYRKLPLEWAHCATLRIMSHSLRYGYHKIITLLCVLIPIPRVMIRI